MNLSKTLVLGVVALFTPSLAWAQLTVPTQDWDGSLNITTNTTIDLGDAVDGTWDTMPTDPSWAAGDGIYDASQWAIVFHYTDVTIDASATLSFTNHASDAPIIWLVSGAVSIEGTIDVSGGFGGWDGYPGAAAPGSFRGGNGSGLAIARGGGFGPGGALANTNGHGSYGTAGNNGGPTYGDDSLIPLLGGSGGAGSNGAGGGGGGAILIASATDIDVNGTIDAQGGGTGDLGAGRGSGGAIRLVAPDITGSGTLNATGGDANAGVGRIRLEYVNAPPALGAVTPAASSIALLPASTAQIWPDAADPLLRIVSLNGVNVPADPEATLSFPWQDVALDGGGGAVTVVLEGTNVPANATVNVFLTRLGGDRLAPTPAVFQSSAGALSTWELTVNGIENGISAIQARAILP